MRQSARDQYVMTWQLATRGLRALQMLAAAGGPRDSLWPLVRPAPPQPPSAHLHLPFARPLTSCERLGLSKWPLLPGAW